MVVNLAMTGPRGRGTFRIFCVVISLVSLLTGYILAHSETRAYQTFLAFGQEGREASRFRQPNNVVVDTVGLLYVADTYNHRIQVFDPNGHFVRAFGSEGAQPGALSRPKGLAWGPDRLLYVADTGNHRAQAFDMQGKVALILGSLGNLPGQFNAPEGIAVGADGTLYVADTQNRRVQKFAPDGRFLLSWGNSGSGQGEFLQPTGIAVDRDGRVLVVDTQNHRVQVFSADGRYLWELGKAGRRAGEFDSPRGIATDDQGYMYVVDTGNGRVQVFDSAGRFHTQVGHLGKLHGEFYYPAGVWVDAQRSLYVADTINHRVQILAYFPALARLEQGWQAFNAARLDAALDEWSEALSLDPTLAEALYGSGLAYARKGNPDLAIDQFKAALALQPEYPAAQWALYRVYLRQVMLPLIAIGLVVTLSSGALLVRRLRRRVLHERARRLLDEGHIRETISTYERLLHLDRNDVEVCKALETLYEQEGLESERQQVNEIIVRLEPDNLHALSYLGRQQFDEHRFAEAQQTWERVLRQDPAWAEGYFYLGAVQAERGEVEPALNSYQHALSLVMGTHQDTSDEQTSDTPHPLEPLVTTWEKVLTEAAHCARALASFQEARRTLAQRYITQGREHLQRDDAKGAIPYLRWVNTLNPAEDSARALLKLAQTSVTFERGFRYYQAQEYVEALRCFRETLALDPEHEKAKRYLRYAQQCLEGGFSERFRHLDLGDREKE